MPFSRSRSMESMTRSATSAPTRNAPVCHSMASTSVVLPWSTCATMATLRRSSRVGMHPVYGRGDSAGRGLGLLLDHVVERFGGHVRPVGPLDRAPLLVQPNLSEERGVSQRLEHRTPADQIRQIGDTFRHVLEVHVHGVIFA